MSVSRQKWGLLALIIAIIVTLMVRRSWFTSSQVNVEQPSQLLSALESRIRLQMKPKEKPKENPEEKREVLPKEELKENDKEKPKVNPSENPLQKPQEKPKENPKQNPETIDKPEEKARSWWLRELGLAENPWSWTWAKEGNEELEDNAFVDLLFPCESTCVEVYCGSSERKMRVKCRSACTDPSSCLPGLNREKCTQAIKQRKPVFGQLCDEDAQRVCSSTSPRLVPYFEFKSKRKLFTLADVAVQVIRGRMQMNERLKVANPASDKHQVAILIAGDSVAHEFLHLARCHFMRTVNTKTLKMTRVSQRPAKQYFVQKEATMAKDRSNRIEWVASSTFTVPSVEFGDIAVKLTFQLGNMAPAQDPELVLDSCIRHDVVLFDWALHYADPFGRSGLYEQEMTVVLEMLKKCLELSKERSEIRTIVYTNHPMQHFFRSHPKGWFNREEPNTPCTKLPVDIDHDEVDGWTRIIRNIAEQSSSSVEQIAITPVAWGNPKTAVCPAAINRDQLRRIYWIPYIDLTEEFYNLKKPKPGDCTHLESLPQFGNPLWDAVFWSVLQQTNEQTQRCLDTSPQPEFSSLAKHRTSDMQRIVNANFREHYEDSQVIDTTLMPLVEDRLKSSEWREQYKEWKNRQDTNSSLEEAAKKVDEARRKKFEN